MRSVGKQDKSTKIELRFMEFLMLLTFSVDIVIHFRIGHKEHIGVEEPQNSSGDFDGGI